MASGGRITLDIPSADTVQDLGRAVCHIKRNWSDDWQLAPALRPQQAAMHAASMGAASAVFRRGYGRGKLPAETAVTTRKPVDLRRWWVRIQVLPGGATDARLQTIWIGRIRKPLRAPRGEDSSGNRRGDQQWIAQGPEALLQRVMVTSSRWYGSAGAADEVRWCPSWNRRGPGFRVQGNRSASLGTDGVYLFANDTSTAGTWTYRQILEYLVQYHFPSAINWYLGGQLQHLDDLTTPIAMPPRIDLWSLLRQLIRPEYGIDFVLQPVDDGWSLFVFALLPETVSFAYNGTTYSCPTNDSQFDLQIASRPDITTTIERSDDALYDTIRLMGARSKVQLSALCDGSAGDKLWTAALESSYENVDSLSTDDLCAIEQDELRTHPQFDSVFRMFGVAAGKTLKDLAAEPHFGSDGSLTDWEGASQRGVRATLPHLLTRDGYSYVTGAAVDNNPTGVEGDYQKCVGICYDDIAGKYVRVDRLQDIDPTLPNAPASALQTEWGLMFNAKPNHLLAKDQMGLSGSIRSQYNPSRFLNYTKMYLLFAVEANHRPMLEASLGSQYQYGDGAVLDIIHEDIQWHGIAPESVIAIDDDGTLVQAPATFGITLRNDLDELARRMPGAIARYLRSRRRVTIKRRGLFVYGSMIGFILNTVVSDGDDEDNIGSPITSVSWTFGRDRTTTIATGHAQR